MATNLQLDDRLIEKAVKLGKHKTKRAAVTQALREYIEHLEQQNACHEARRVSGERHARAAGRRNGPDRIERVGRLDDEPQPDEYERRDVNEEGDDEEDEKIC